MFITENSAQKASFLLFSSFAFKVAHNLRVGGSSPSGSTKNSKPLHGAAFYFFILCLPQSISIMEEEKIKMSIFQLQNDPAGIILLAKGRSS